ncbi:MAG: HAD-IC family P-type ATPase [Deferrisomatales bacterium]|nr:HAD-IC family P-type ATPase [Deferrisomatales bacterium]
MTLPLQGLDRPHALSPTEALEQLGTGPGGLNPAQAAERLAIAGPNALPRDQPPSLVKIFLNQFKSPLIYVLLLAAVMSLLLRELSDAGFIFAVLLLNAGIGTFQEFHAERSAQALQGLVSARSQVQRDGEIHEIDTEQLVPGDIVLLESGAKVPADLRLLDTHALTMDESLLTGESEATTKRAVAVLDAATVLGDRANMAFAGTMVNTGRARGVVVATSLRTELGRIAASVVGKAPAKPPLLLRLERFTRGIAAAVGLAALLVAALELSRGSPLADIFLLAVALAVSAIPEGLPVAVTVALAVGMRRMSRRAVIVRKLVAVEALGSCTYIASDKTGTLTVNQLTVRRVQVPGQPPWEVTGEGLAPEGEVRLPSGCDPEHHGPLLARLCRAATLANEAVLARRDDQWHGHGDAVDLALLVLAQKAGVAPSSCQHAWPQLDLIPYEPERRYAASLNRHDQHAWIHIKGAVETLLPMCAAMAGGERDLPLRAEEILAQATQLAAGGFRVLAVAAGATEAPGGEFSSADLAGLTFLGLVAMSDPPRAEARESIAACQGAGITVAMVTGDHPVTAAAVARDLDLVEGDGQVTTGLEVARAVGQGETALDSLVRRSRVFARVQPEQKLQIVQSLQRSGHFVAVTGDGVNDAPALRAAHVGVALGRRGTDVARETAEIILTDDNFTSIAAGIEEGRIAYGNIRKVIFLLVSTGAAEIVLFLLALLAGLPLPLLAVQLLWLNLVTNGIQDVALAFEPGEGDELRRPPRPPREPIFNRLMLERVLLSALAMGGAAFAVWAWMLQSGWQEDSARNALLLLMVLFENVQAFNSRSETLSVFRHNPLRNRLLLFGTLAAQLVHIGALYTPGLNTVLGLFPVSLALWANLLVMALVLLAVMELHKLVWKRLRR